jgi:hypothetical protein
MGASHRLFYDFALTGDCGKKGAADIVFLLDSSGSVGEENFERMKNFTKQIVDEFTIAADAVQFGVVIFSTPVTGAFPLNMYRDSEQLKAAISAIKFQNGETHTGKALEYLRLNSFSSKEGKHCVHYCTPNYLVSHLSFNIFN